MAYIGTYIRQILTEKDPVILPGFGSLVIVEGKGSKGEDGKIDPPGPVVRFDPNHPKGDGKLAGVYANGEGLDQEEARQQVLELVDAIKFKLDKGEKYVLDDVGIFSRDDDNRVLFKKDSGWILDPDLFGLESLDLLELDAEEKEKEEAKVNQEKPPETKFEPEPEIPVRKVQRRPVRKWRIIWIIVGSLIVVLLAILLIPSGEGIEFGKDGIVLKGSENETEQPSVEQDITSETQVDNQFETADRQDQGLTPEDEPQEVEEPNMYFIIAGSFQNLQNATELMDQLRSDGFPAEMIMTENRTYRVSIKSYPTKQGAIDDLSAIRSASGVSGAWVLVR